MSWALLSQSNAVRLGVGDERDRFCCSDGFKGQDCAPVSVRRRTGFTEYTTSQIPMLWPLSTATSMHLIKSKTEQQSWQSIFHLFLLLILHASFVHFYGGGKNGKSIAYGFFPVCGLKQNIISSVIFLTISSEISWPSLTSKLYSCLAQKYFMKNLKCVKLPNLYSMRYLFMVVFATTWEYSQGCFLLI